MSKGADRIFIDIDIKEHFIGLLSDSDKRWGVQFVNDESLPVSLDECDDNDIQSDNHGYGAVRGQRRIDTVRDFNAYD